MRAAARRAVGVLGGVALTVAACSGGDDGDGTGLSGPLPGAGSSAQENAMLGWIAGFQDRHPDVLISYDPVGSGSGREMLLNGAVLFAGSDAAMSPEELEQGTQRCHGGEVIELPLYIAPIAVAYHLPELGAEHINMTPEVIAQAFTGQITSWDDPAIAELNPDLELPAAELVPVNRSDDSGTTE
ncbi:phosphate ABC transporter substrate-binding protein PstS, partial [Georgenia sp. 10Sc9-8]|nr:phosphate ABC transporter substrate-binding protein PstS [Georgenia halotolerans]